MEPNSPYVEKVRANRFKLWENGKSPLTSLDIELTERCNNNCIHCYINQPAEDEQIIKKELGTNKIKTIISEAAALGCLTIKFTGGEPLVREDFEEIYIHTRKLGIKVALLTNATLITPRLADIFSRIPPLEDIEITYYGMRRSSYEAVSRVPGSFKAASRGINLLVKKKVPFVLKNVLIPPVMNEVDEFECFASQLPGSHGKPESTISLNLRCRRDSDAKNSRIRKLRLTPDKQLAFFVRDEDKYKAIMQQFCTNFMGSEGLCLFTCGAGVRGGTVDAYGCYQLCMLLRHPATVYNLNVGSLRDAVTVFSKTIRTLDAQNPVYLRRCARCFLKGLCEQCPGKSWMEHGTLDTPVEYLCKIAHAKARFLGLIGDDEKAWKITTKLKYTQSAISQINP